MRYFVFFFLLFIIPPREIYCQNSKSNPIDLTFFFSKGNTSVFSDPKINKVLTGFGFEITQKINKPISLGIAFSGSRTNIFFVKTDKQYEFFLPNHSSSYNVNIFNEYRFENINLVFNYNFFNYNRWGLSAQLEPGYCRIYVVEYGSIKSWYMGKRGTGTWSKHDSFSLYCKIPVTYSATEKIKIGLSPLIRTQIQEKSLLGCFMEFSLAIRVK